MTNKVIEMMETTNDFEQKLDIAMNMVDESNCLEMCQIHKYIAQLHADAVDSGHEIICDGKYQDFISTTFEGYLDYYLSQHENMEEQLKEEIATSASQIVRSMHGHSFAVMVYHHQRSAFYEMDTKTVEDRQISQFILTAILTEHVLTQQMNLLKIFDMQRGALAIVVVAEGEIFTMRKKEVRMLEPDLKAFEIKGLKYGPQLLFARPMDSAFQNTQFLS